MLGSWVSQFWYVLALHSREKLKFHVATIYGCGSQSSFFYDTKSKIEFVLLSKQYRSLPAPHLSRQISRDFDVTSYILRDDYRIFGKTYSFIKYNSEHWKIRFCRNVVNRPPDSRKAKATHFHDIVELQKPEPLSSSSITWIQIVYEFTETYNFVYTWHHDLITCRSVYTVHKINA